MVTGIEFLGKVLNQKLSKLKHVELDFSHCSKITDKQLINFSQALREGNSSIKEFKFRCSEQQKVTSSGLAALIEAVFLGLPSISCLQLEFSHCKDIDNIPLVPNVKLNNLQQLELNFSGCRALADTCILALNFELAKNSQNLKVLSHNFALCSFLTDNSLKSLAQTLPMLSGLETLELNYSYCEEISESAFISILEAFQSVQHSKLTQIKFELNSNTSKITDKWFSSFYKVVDTKLTSLTHIDVSFRNAKVTDEGFQLFGKAVKRVALTLRSLRIGIISCKDITDKGLEALFETLEKDIHRLSSLRLELRQLQISGKTIRALCDALKGGAKDIKSFFIGLAAKQNVFDEGCKYLEEVLLNGLPNLEYIRINLESFLAIDAGTGQKIREALLARRWRPKEIIYNNCEV